jgi:hypothetical protein
MCSRKERDPARKTINGKTNLSSEPWEAFKKSDSGQIRARLHFGCGSRKEEN